MKQRTSVHSRKAFLIGSLAALGIALVGLAIGAGDAAQAADPSLTFKAYAVAVTRDEPAPAPTAPATRTPLPGATPTATPSPSSTPTPGAPGEINIAPQLDTAHAVSKLITYAAGGTLTTTGADGSRYTLTLPPHSMLVDMVVTMTPLIGASGLPAGGGLKAGVQIEPDGMRLGVPATLDIVPASPVSRQQEISFSYGENGKQAYGHGLDVGTTAMRFTLLHFSGWAIAGGDDSARQAFFQSRVDSVSAQVSQRFAEAIARERARGGETNSPEFVLEMEAAILDAYNTVVQPAMDTAEALADGGDIDSVEPGIQAWLSFERMLQLLGYTGLEGERAALQAQFFRILDKVITNAHKRCVEKHDLGMVSKLLSLGRTGELMRGDGGRAMELALKCATFKLNFETTIIMGQVGGAIGWSFQVRSFEIPIQMLDTSGFPVTKPIEKLAFDSVLPKCAFDGSGVTPTSPFVVNSATLVVKWVNHKMVVEDVALAFEMGDMSGSVSWRCEGGSTVGPVPFGPESARGMFNSFHVAEAGPSGFVPRGWEIVGGSLYAQKAYSQSGVNSERTVLTLRHTPE